MTIQLALPSEPPFDLIAKYARGLLQGNILLEGPPGIGKSTLARHIMRTSLADPDNFSVIDVYNGGTWSSDMLTRLENSMLNQKTLYGESFAYSVIDEFDLLSSRDMYDLRARQDKWSGSWGVIMTTNHLGRIPEPIQSRSEVISLPLPTIDQLVVSGRQALNASGVDISSEKLRDIARRCGGDFRKMERAVNQVIGNMKP